MGRSITINTRERRSEDVTWIDFVTIVSDGRSLKVYDSGKKI